MIEELKGEVEFAGQLARVATAWAKYHGVNNRIDPVYIFLAKHGPALIRAVELAEAVMERGMTTCSDDYGMHYWCPACDADVDDIDGYGRPDFNAPDHGVRHREACPLVAYRAAKKEAKDAKV